MGLRPMRRRSARASLACRRSSPAIRESLDGREQSPVPRHEHALLPATQAWAVGNPTVRERLSVYQRVIACYDSRNAGVLAIQPRVIGDQRWRRGPPSVDGANRDRTGDLLL